MYCAEWDLLFILGGRKLQLFEIVRHDCRRLAEKMRHTRMNAVPHSIVWFFFFFPDKTHPICSPFINLTLCTVILLETLLLKFLQVSTSSAPRPPVPPVPVRADPSSASKVLAALITHEAPVPSTNHCPAPIEFPDLLWVAGVPWWTWPSPCYPRRRGQ